MVIDSIYDVSEEKIEWGVCNWDVRYDFNGISFCHKEKSHSVHYIHLTSLYGGFHYYIQKVKSFVNSEDNILNFGGFCIVCKSKKYKEEVLELFNGWYAYFKNYCKYFCEAYESDTCSPIEFRYKISTLASIMTV